MDVLHRVLRIQKKPQTCKKDQFFSKCQKHDEKLLRFDTQGLKHQNCI